MDAVDSLVVELTRLRKSKRRISAQYCMASMHIVYCHHLGSKHTHKTEVPVLEKYAISLTR